MRRVLLVTYFFPPLGGGGVQRTLGHVRHLPQAGWQPIVVTAKDPGYEIRDPDLLTLVPPDVEVHRSFIWEPSRFYRWLVSASGYARHKATSEAQRRERERAAPPSRPGEREGSAGSGNREGARRQAGLWASLARWLIFPDDQVTWLPFGVRSAVQVVRSTDASAVYSSSPPITGHLIAGLVKRWRHVPWIADFRDPWIGNAFALPLPRFHRLAQRRVERWIVSTADRCVFATPSLTAMYQHRYPDIADRFMTIPNGYDLADYPPRTPPSSRTDRRFRLVYAGSLYGDSELLVFISGLRLAVARRPNLREQLQVEFVGWLSGRNRDLSEQAAHDEEIGPMLTFTGFLPRAEALAHLASADAAMHLLSDEPGKELFVAGKLFDYLAMDLPVLAMVPEGDARAMLESLGWGTVVDPTPAGFAEGLERLVDEPAPRRAADPLGRFGRSTLARQLAGVLNEVEAEASKRRGGGPSQ